MRVFAPGKLVVTGAYAVLAGAPAVVIATNRGASADDAIVERDPTREVRAAFGDDPAPYVDASALHEGAKKLGLGASAAILVASLGVRAARRGEDVRSRAVRDRILAEAREAHARAQGGGSGVDVAASVHGGILVYTLAGNTPLVEPAAFPPGLVIRAFFSGESARTSDLLARVDALAARDADLHKGALERLAAPARHARAALLAGDTPGFVIAARATAEGLLELGRRADAPIVPASFAQLAEAAGRDEAAFLGSGAGGGDVALWVGLTPPGPDFLGRASDLGMTPLDISLDTAGLRLEDDHG